MIKVSKRACLLWFCFVVFPHQKLYYFFHYVISSSQHIFIYGVVRVILDSLKQSPRQIQKLQETYWGWGSSCERRRMGTGVCDERVQLIIKFWCMLRERKVNSFNTWKTGLHTTFQWNSHRSWALTCPLLFLGFSKETVTGSGVVTTYLQVPWRTRILLPLHPCNALFFTVYPNPLHAELIQ